MRALILKLLIAVCLISDCVSIDYDLVSNYQSSCMQYRNSFY